MGLSVSALTPSLHLPTQGSWAKWLHPHCHGKQNEGVGSTEQLIHREDTKCRKETTGRGGAVGGSTNSIVFLAFDVILTKFLGRSGGAPARGTAAVRALAQRAGGIHRLGAGPSGCQEAEGEIGRAHV